MKRYIAILLLMIGVLLPNAASAGVGNKIVRETAELLMRRGGKEVAEETVETIAKKMTTLAARHGDDVVSAAFRRVGPRAGRIASEAGEHSGVALRLLSKHGDDALRLAARPKALTLAAKFGDDVAEPLIRHGEVAEKLVERFGTDGVEALGKLSERNVRRLAMLAEEHGEKVTPGLVQAFAKHSHADTLADYVWRNKGALFVGGTLAAFVAQPEPFLNAAETVATKTLDSAVQPVVTEAARQFPWGLTIVIGLCVVMAIVIERIGVPMVLRKCTGMAVAKLKDLRKQPLPRFIPKEKENKQP